ncbi:MAG: hypothetical protein F4Y80_09530 [Caldilineaceae bacterium SB0665_bin_21]|nr:hypothetical protein [Caldilineaceae bacterium SB0665_bin_21]
MSSQAPSCPIWENPPAVQEIDEWPLFCPSPRAGGRFLLARTGAPLLQKDRLNDRRRANLSYWIYHHNLQYRLFDEFSEPRRDPLVLNQAWVEGHWDRTPSSSDRMLTFLRELIRCDDAGQQPLDALLMAAGGCRNDSDLAELRRHAVEQGWTGSRAPNLAGAISSNRINLPARIHVEAQLGEQGRGRQAFVAMWFDKSMDDAYKRGIKPAIKAAGYQPRLIKNKEYLGDVTDEIVAEIRKSRFVVADFTSSRKAGAGGVSTSRRGSPTGCAFP